MNSKFFQEIDTLVRGGIPLIFIDTTEHSRCIREIEKIVKHYNENIEEYMFPVEVMVDKFSIMVYNYLTGLKFLGKEVGHIKRTNDIIGALEFIKTEDAQFGFYIFPNFDVWVNNKYAGNSRIPFIVSIFSFFATHLVSEFKYIVSRNPF